jgi:hypothetical protein
MKLLGAHRTPACPRRPGSIGAAAEAALTGTRAADYQAEVADQSDLDNADQFL